MAATRVWVPPPPHRFTSAAPAPSSRRPGPAPGVRCHRLLSGRRKRGVKKAPPGAGRGGNAGVPRSADGGVRTGSPRPDGSPEGAGRAPRWGWAPARAGPVSGGTRPALWAGAKRRRGRGCPGPVPGRVFARPRGSPAAAGPGVCFGARGAPGLFSPWLIPSG